MVQKVLQLVKACLNTNAFRKRFASFSLTLRYLLILGGPKRTHPAVPGIPGGTRAGAGKIGRMIAEEIMEIHR